MELIIIMVSLRILGIILATRSSVFREYALIPNRDIRIFCWLMMFPFVGDAIFVVVVGIAAVNYINKNIFVVK